MYANISSHKDRLNRNLSSGTYGKRQHGSMPSAVGTRGIAKRRRRKAGETVF